MLETFDSADALTDAAALGIESCLAEALRSGGEATLVATGGRSPGAVYDRLAVAGLDWARVTVTLSDERCVAPDAPEANARLVRERLLQGPAAKARLLPLWPDPGRAALEALAPFDAVMLGMGEDGHVASLFPDAPDEVVRSQAVYLPVIASKPPPRRITMNFATLAAARQVWVLASGMGKEDALRRSLSTNGDTPLARVLHLRDQTVIFTDITL